MFKRYSLAQLIPHAMSAVLIGACAAEVPPRPGPEETAKENFVAGTRLYVEKLSQTASLEVWDQGDDGVLINVSGHNEYDADKQALLQEAVDAEDSSSLVRIYRHLRPEQTEVPSKLIEIDRMMAEREAAAAPEPQRAGARSARPADAEPDKAVVVEEIAEPDLPRADESPWTWMALWFRDTFCSYPGNEQGVCWLDGRLTPYAQQTGTGARHIITANTDEADIRFRGWGSGCQFWCSFDLAWDVRVTAGHYSQYHWLNSTRITDRRGRIDPYGNPLIQFSMNWSGSSGGSGCRGTGVACSQNSDCCLTTATTMCVRGVCANDPTPTNRNCDWTGEVCCGGTVTSDLYCNRTADPNLWCVAGTCRH